MCDSTVMNYFKLQEIEKDIKRGTFNELTMDEMIDRVCNRRLGCGLNRKIALVKDKYKDKNMHEVAGRLIRVSTPLE